MRRAALALSSLLSLALTAVAQEPTDPAYSRLNTFSGFFEYSNDSSHIILGQAENRKIGAIGFQYQRRLVHRRLLDFSFTAEARPGMIESAQLCISLLAIVAAIALLARWMKIPGPILMVVAGLLLALIPGLPHLKLDPSFALMLFLPPLVYAAAVQTSWRDFRANLRPIGLLAVGCVLFTTAAVARCRTPFSGPTHRSWESLVSARQNPAKSAVISPSVCPTTTRARELQAATHSSLPRPMVKVKPCPCSPG